MGTFFGWECFLVEQFEVFCAGSGCVYQLLLSVEQWLKVVVIVFLDVSV